MDDITTIAERVRGCLSDLWNTYFYAGDDMAIYPAVIQDLFEEIESRLFAALLLLPLDRIEFEEKFRSEALPFLLVVPAADGVPVLVNRPSADGNRYWDAFEGHIGPNDITLQFVEWFDWNRYGRRSFQYYLAKVHAFEKRPEFLGRDALIECRSARMLFDPTPGGVSRYVEP